MIPSLNEVDRIQNCLGDRPINCLWEIVLVGLTGYEDLATRCSIIIWTGVLN